MTAPTKYGPIHLLKGDYISDHFARGQHYEVGMAEHLVRLCGNKRTAIDVGANIGSHTIVYQSFFEKVIAIEPQEVLIPLLEKTAGENVTIINAAAGHVEGICNVVDKYDGTPGNYGARGIGVHGTPHRMITIDSLEIEDLDLLKIDTEGSEFLVLFGAQETIKRCKPVIMFERIGHDHFVKVMRDFCGPALDFDGERFLYGLEYSISIHGKNVVCKPK